MLEPLGLLDCMERCLGSDARVVRTAKVLLPAYRTTRSLLEVFLDSFGQSILQLYVFVRLVRLQCDRTLPSIKIYR